ncbi:MAG: HdeD family acid-resistance protein [Halobacteriota archaeon]
MSEEDLYLGRQPWSMAAEGILALIIGALILAWPGMTLVTLTWIVGIFVLLTGICALIALIGSHKGQRGVLIAGGLLGIILGCIFLAWPIGTTAVLLWLLMIWLVLYGIYRIVHAIRQPPEDHSRWLDICLGIISLVVGVLLIALPALEGLEVLALLLGIYAVIAGIILICLAGAEWSKRKHMQTG